MSSRIGVFPNVSWPLHASEQVLLESYYENCGIQLFPSPLIHKFPVIVGVVSEEISISLESYYASTLQAAICDKSNKRFS